MLPSFPTRPSFLFISLGVWEFGSSWQVSGEYAMLKAAAMNGPETLYAHPIRDAAITENEDLNKMGPYLL